MPIAFASVFAGRRNRPPGVEAPTTGSGQRIRPQRMDHRQPFSLSGLEGQRVRADVEIDAARKAVKAVHVKRVAESK
jgi:hypothetical protein